MTPRHWMLATAAAAAVLVPSIVAADVMQQIVRGRVEAVDTSSGARGDYRMEVRDINGRVEETLNFRGRRLGALPDQNGDPPVYHVVLIDSGGTKTADFGAVRLNRNGSAGLHFRSRKDDFPVGVTSLTEFGGGTFELQRDAAAVLRGTIPAFVGLDGDASKDAFAHFHGKARLTPTPDGGAARGDIQEESKNGPNRSFQRLRIAIRLVGTVANPFTVVAIDGAQNETVIGTITARGGRGEGALKFDTRQGDTIPGGGLAGLSGQTIEVRNGSNVAVLTGKFPTVP
jgi:hypothetical protein